MGAAKTGGNYASSLVAQQEAIDKGFDQVVFLDAFEHKWVEELGGMNLYFVHDDGTIVTPELTGTILEGITRGSIIELAGTLGHKVEERRFSIDEWRDGVERRSDHRGLRLRYGGRRHPGGHPRLGGRSGQHRRGRPDR